MTKKWENLREKPFNLKRVWNRNETLSRCPEKIEIYSIYFTTASLWVRANLKLISTPTSKHQTANSKHTKTKQRELNAETHAYSRAGPGRPLGLPAGFSWLF